MRQSFWQRFKLSPAHSQVNIVCTAVVMVATIAYSIIAGFQLVAMNKQLEVVRGTLAETKRSGEQSTEQMWSAIGNLNWMARSMDLSQQQAQTALQSSMDNFHVDQRAWIGPKEMALHPMAAPNPVEASMTIVNSGKTAAFKLGFSYFLHASDEPIDVEQYFRHPVEYTAGQSSTITLLPGGTIFLSPSTGPTDAQGIQSVENGKKLLYLFASAHYLDVFGAHHTTRVCAIYDHRTKQFDSCPGGFDHAD